MDYFLVRTKTNEPYLLFVILNCPSTEEIRAEVDKTMCTEKDDFSLVIIDRLLTYGDTSGRFLCHKIENYRVN